MPRDLTVQMQADVQADLVRPFLAFEVEGTSGFIRLWSGVGTIVVFGETYIGMGKFAGLSPAKETTDLSAEGLQVSLSGIPSDVLAAALGELQQSYPATVYYGHIDQAGVIVPTPFILWEGLTDVPEGEEAAETSMVRLSVESEHIDLDRPRTRRYTSADQQLDFPGDLGFDYVPALQDKELVFDT